MRLLALLRLACLFSLSGRVTAPAAIIPTAQPRRLTADAGFQLHAANVLEEIWREFPNYVVRMGCYKYADQMTVPDRARRDRSLPFYD